MPWFKVDDSFHSHPKVLAASPAALGLWVVAGTWCSANTTDGFVPDYVLPRLLPDPAELAEQLVTCRLWKRTRGGYRFHDWLNYNPSADSVNTEREAARERMRKLRENRKTTRSPAGQDTNGSAEQPANVRDLFGGSSQPRPDPTRSSSKEELPQKTSSSSERAPSAKRGTRLPDDFRPTTEMVAWARERTPHVDGKHETEKFINYWQAKSGQQGVKLDWVATWRNWMLTAAERLGTPSQVIGHRSQPFKNPPDMSTYYEEL